MTDARIAPVIRSEPAAPRPTVTIHVAQTLDGRIATRTGDSQWVSGPRSLRLAHQLRAEHDAVMVGIGTALADNPRLTVRLARGRSPRRIVVDSTLRIPLDSRVLADRAAETILATTARAAPDRIRAVEERGATVLIAAQNPRGQVDLSDLLARLAARDVGSILVEGGRGVITAVLHDRLADRMVICIAPKVIGAGIEAIGDLDIHRLGEALTFSRSCFSLLDEDVIFDGQLAAPPSP